MQGVQSPIAYIGIIDSQDQPLYLRSFMPNKDDDIQSQMFVYSSLELIESIMKERLARSTTSLNSYIGFLTNVFLCDSEYDIMGYYSPTKLRIILVLNQKQNLENYNESVLKQIFKSVHDLYLQDLFNPFTDIKEGLSSSFDQKCQRLIESQQKAL
mmetsp:Transcript_73925/g.85823  ORF Transcript_73925/g.85823 Transcript_73925/m.85823 type:complete len:156 (-) Transcript_73925:21-488(-)